MNQLISGVGGIKVNLSPDAFRMGAEHYYKCYLDFKPPHKFSPLPYFLLCRSLELLIKSFHLNTKSQDDVKSSFGHDLISAYEGLAKKYKILTSDEYEELQTASELYSTKGFEYFNPEDALRGYSNYPDLAILHIISTKMLNIET